VWKCRSAAITQHPLLALFLSNCNALHASEFDGFAVFPATVQFEGPSSGAIRVFETSVDVVTPIGAPEGFGRPARSRFGVDGDVERRASDGSSPVRVWCVLRQHLEPKNFWRRRGP